jgi:hypothetical protein
MVDFLHQIKKTSKRLLVRVDRPNRHLSSSFVIDDGKKQLDIWNGSWQVITNNRENRRLNRLANRIKASETSRSVSSRKFTHRIKRASAAFGRFLGIGSEEVMPTSYLMPVGLCFDYREVIHSPCMYFSPA